MKPRHPELVSGTIYRPAPKPFWRVLIGRLIPATPAFAAEWVLKQVQHDDCVKGVVAC